MSQFNLPRINFIGKGTLDPATANNGFYLPLVIYDPVNVKAFLPPRLYFSPGTTTNSIEEIARLVPEGAKLKTDNEGHLNGIPYVEIDPIDTIEVYHKWATTPLGSFTADRAYVPLYKAVTVPNTGKSLFGIIPGYWNYYGTMKMAYGWEGKNGFEEVSISSVALSDGHGNEKLYYDRTPKCPEDLKKLLGAKVTIDNIFEDHDTYTAVMIDLDPTFALYTQIFNDSFGIYDEDTTFLKGNPSKGSLRFVNVFRIVNEVMPNSGSGNFCSTISMEDLEQGMDSPIMKIFSKYGDKKGKLKGVFIHQNILEVQENRPPDYKVLGKNSNPAKVTIAGCVTPWYEGQYKTVVMARQLVPKAPIIQNKDEVDFLPTFIANQDDRNKILTFDLLNVVPIFNKDFDPKHPSPGTDEDPNYVSYDLGKLSIVLELPNNEAKVIGTLTINEKNYSRLKCLKTGGIVRMPYRWDNNLMRKGNLAVYKNYGKAGSIKLMEETQYMISTDQPGLYANQGDDPAHGYVADGYPKTDCRILIYEKGRPIKHEIPICLMENVVTQNGSAQATGILRNTFYKHEDVVTFPTRDAMNAMFLILPYHTKKPMSVVDLQKTILFTGSFVSLRVLPRHDYGKYIDPHHPEYPVEVTWEVIYEEIMKNIEQLYPFMADFIPFTKENWDNGMMAGQLVNRINNKNWSSFHYMPPSRDLSDDQKKLIYKWAENHNVYHNEVPWQDDPAGRYKAPSQAPNFIK